MGPPAVVYTCAKAAGENFAKLYDLASGGAQKTS